MSKNSAIALIQETRIDALLRYHQTVMSAAAQMAVAAAKCGLEMKAIKKELGHGNWEPWFEANLASRGFSLRTGQRYMALADGLKGKLLKNDTGAVFELLDSAPSALTVKQQQTLTKAVSKAADGKTVSELYEIMGIAKKPQGSGAKGGNTRKGDKEPTEATNAEVLVAGQREQVKQLGALLAEYLTDRPWNVCDLAERQQLHGLLVDAAHAVKDTFKATP